MLDAFDAEDNVVSLTPQQIQDKLTTDSAVPRGFQVALVHGVLIIYRVQLVDCLPEVQASVTLRSDLTIVIALNQKRIPSTQYWKGQAQTQRRY